MNSGSMVGIIPAVSVDSDLCHLHPQPWCHPAHITIHHLDLCPLTRPRCSPGHPPPHLTKPGDPGTRRPGLRPGPRILDRAAAFAERRFLGKLSTSKKGRAGRAHWPAPILLPRPLDSAAVAQTQDTPLCYKSPRAERHRLGAGGKPEAGRARAGQEVYPSLLSPTPQLHPNPESPPLVDQDGGGGTRNKLLFLKFGLQRIFEKANWTLVGETWAPYSIARHSC